MQLNNKKTQGIIVIDEVRPDLLLFSEYENTYLKETTEILQKGFVWYLDKDKNIENQTINQFEKVEAYNFLLKKFPDYEISEDSQNWKYSTRIQRLTIPNTIITESILNQDSFSLIINRMIAENKVEIVADRNPYIYRGETQAICYINDVNPEDQAVVLPLIEEAKIFIENKI